MSTRDDLRDVLEVHIDRPAPASKPLPDIDGPLATAVRRLVVAVLQMHPDAQVIGKVMIPLADCPVAMVEVERNEVATLIRVVV